MTALSTDFVQADGELVLPEPVGKQREWLDSPATRKVLRVGRRGSKTRFALLAGILGHGPGWEDQAPTMPGILSGGDVIWVAQDYPNLTRVVWREEIRPRFGHLPWASLNERDHALTIDGLGTLFLVSAEAINGIRGMGKNVKGVIIDEAAWLALRSALQDVILAVLLDNGGWLIIMSTTNAGSDGGYDDQGAPQIPSYFNLLCKEIRAGKRSEEWQEFTGTAYDNPTLSTKAIDELIAEYTPDSPKLKQEVFAELLTSGVGLALPKLMAERHIVPRFHVPDHWTRFAAFDWGFNHPWKFGYYACDGDGNVTKTDTLTGREDLPEAIVTTILTAFPELVELRVVIHAGHDIFARKGQAVGYAGPTIAETFWAHELQVIKANIDRVAGLDNLRGYAYWDAAWPSERRPRFVLMDTPGNKASLASLQSMQLDPNNLEDALKVDANASGLGGDDDYDETRYALMSRPLHPAALANGKPEDIHPGINMSTGVRLDQGKRVTLSAIMAKQEQTYRRPGVRMVRPGFGRKVDV